MAFDIYISACRLLSYTPSLWFWSSFLFFWVIDWSHCHAWGIPIWGSCFNPFLVHLSVNLAIVYRPCACTGLVIGFHWWGLWSLHAFTQIVFRSRRNEFLDAIFYQHSPTHTEIVNLQLLFYLLSILFPHLSVSVSIYYTISGKNGM